eukprot:2287551-Amphidinium_carterae.2
MSTGCKDVTEAVRSKDVGTVAPSLLDLRHCLQQGSRFPLYHIFGSSVRSCRYAGETARADRNIVMRAVSKQGVGCRASN